MATLQRQHQTNDGIEVASGGVGIHWHMRLTRNDLPGVIVDVGGSARGYARSSIWTVRVIMDVPADRNRQPKPNGGTYLSGPQAGQSWSRRVENVSRTVSKHGDRNNAVEAAYKLIREMDREALLGDIIERMWASEFANDCNSYLKLGTDDAALREARIEAIRAMRKADPAFAELFPEPPNKNDY